MFNPLPYLPEVASRFWARVEVGGEQECWPWTGQVTHKGYGRLSIRMRNYKANRVAWMLGNKAETPADLLVCHSCDNRLCVNPAHLWLGTFSDNNRDARDKGRAKPSKPLTHCLRGHAMTDDNVRLTHRKVRKPYRCCLACVALRRRTYQAARSAARATGTSA